MGHEERVQESVSVQDVHGYVEAFWDGKWIGWVARIDGYDQPLLVQVWHNGEIIAEGLADKYRLDLQRLGMGRGHHGFEIAVPPRTALAHADEFEIREATSSAKLANAGHFTTDASDEPSDLLFDAAFYNQQGGPERGGLAHYKAEGWRLGFDPHPLFHTRFYSSRYVHDDTTDPLTHFQTIGILSGTDTHPLFDVEFYARATPGLRIHPLIAYLSDAGERSEPSPFFSDTAYTRRDEPQPAQGLIHYLTIGFGEGRHPHPEFDPRLFASLADLTGDQEPFSLFVAEMRLPKREAAAASIPLASIIILNHQKAVTTLQCLYFVRKHTSLENVEIIVVDNGSTPENFALLTRYGGEVRIIRLNENKGFGEANNLAAEEARGEFLVFLNNDVFVTAGWLAPLLSAFDDARVGAAGPKFLQVDGQLQEAGCSISFCGTAVQRGRALNANDPLFNQPGFVDYCSGATLVVRKSAFEEVLGYDLCWGLAYYEDADLCLKLRLFGLATFYVPHSEVIHLEHVTSSDVSLGLQLKNAVTINRAKFVERWGRYLANGGNGEALRNRDASLKQDSGKPFRLALFTPYPLHAGGGERYLLSIAAALQNRFQCSLVTPDRYSTVRVKTLARDLCLDLDDMTMLRVDEAVRQAPFDLFVCMNNEVLPALAPMGRKNLFHCQFPFPISATSVAQRWAYLDFYDGLIVNSQYTARHMRREARNHGLRLPTMDVLYPPGPGDKGFPAAKKELPHIILSVGRFEPKGHCKNQARMIAEFGRLLKAVTLPVELHLVGVVGDDAASRDYFLAVCEDARGLPVFFHPNATPERISELYDRASLYWHLTGGDEDVNVTPELFEHFGISIVEAMSAGAVPIAIRYGGPAEIVADGTNGALITSVHELSACSARLLTSDDLPAMRRAAQERGRDFSFAKFTNRLNNIVSFVMESSLPC